MAEKDTSNMSRTRNWTFLVYPDSSPENWRDILDEEHLEWVESPIHDKDLNPTGEVKKPHWHVLILFGGVKTYEQVLEVLKPLNCTIPQKVQNAKSLIRYFAHLDNPDKAQYRLSDVIAHGGVDVLDLLAPTKSQRYSLLRDMFDYIEEHNLTEYKDFVNYARIHHYDDWWPLICDNSTYLLTSFIKSQRHSKQSGSALRVCSETGEIISEC